MDFRFKALRHQHDPDDLDTSVNLANPKSWIALFVTLVILVAATAWALLGSLPQTVVGDGVLSRAGSVLRVKVDYPGLVQRSYVVAGQQVSAGAPLVTVTDQSGAPHQLTAPASGTVMVSDAIPGVVVDPGDSLVTIERAPAAGPALSAMIVVPAQSAAAVQPGMAVDLSLSDVSASTFGLLRGRVSTISAYPLTSLELGSLVYDSVTIGRMMAGDAVVLVTVDLLVDPSTPSGYSWSSPTGPPYRLSFQSGVNGAIHLGQRRPINYVFGDS